MTASARGAPDRRGRTTGRRRRVRRLLAWAVRLAVAIVVFATGVAVGKALRDNPERGGDRTFVRTLKPLPLAPARETVTVTVTNP